MARFDVDGRLQRARHAYGWRGGALAALFTSDLRNGMHVSCLLALLVVCWRMSFGGWVGIAPAYARFIFAKIYRKTPKDTAVLVVEAPSVDSLVWALTLRVAAPGEDW